jgi:hypothetical protein
MNTNGQQGYFRRAFSYLLQLVHSVTILIVGKHSI